MRTDLVALFEFEQDRQDIRVAAEKHYWLVPPEDITDEDITDEDMMQYRQRISDRP